MLSGLLHSRWVFTYHCSLWKFRKNQPYYPTLPSTTMGIKDECSRLGPKAVVSSVESAARGIEEVSYPGELPRNELQVSTF